MIERAGWNLLLSCFLGATGCRDSTPAGAKDPVESTEGVAAVKERGVSVVGDAVVDYGKMELTGEPLRHVFVLRNDLDEPVAVKNVKKSCTCLSVEIEPRTLPAGGEARVEVTLDTRAVSGKASTAILVEFDRESVKPALLKLEAFMVSDYTVTILPRVWAVKAQTESGVRAQRAFRVTEFFSRHADEGGTIASGSTRLRTKSEFVRVHRLGEWKDVGWKRLGFAREAELVLELDLPEDFQDRQATVYIEFEHSGDEVGRAARPSEVSTVALRIEVF